MLIYEVNVDVDQDIAEPFLAWLKHHVAEIIKIDGFSGAEIFARDAEDSPESTGKVLWTAHYFLKDRSAYERYVQAYAPAFRQDGLDKFGEKFKATRRILTPYAKF